MLPNSPQQYAGLQSGIRNQVAANASGTEQTMAPDNGAANSDNTRNYIMQQAAERFSGVQPMAPDPNPGQERSMNLGGGTPLGPDPLARQTQQESQQPTHDYFGRPLQQDERTTQPGSFAPPQRQEPGAPGWPAFDHGRPQVEQQYQQQQPQPQTQQTDPSQSQAPEGVIRNYLASRGLDVANFASDDQALDVLGATAEQVLNFARWDQAQSQQRQPQQQSQPHAPSMPQPQPHERAAQTGDDGDFEDEWHYHVQFDPEQNAYVPRGQYANPEVVQRANQWRHRYERNIRRIGSNPDKFVDERVSQILEQQVPQIVEQRVAQMQQARQRYDSAVNHISSRAPEFLQFDANGQVLTDHYGNAMLTPAGRAASAAVQQFQQAFKQANPGANLDPMMIAQIIDTAVPRNQQQYMPQQQVQQQPIQQQQMLPQAPGYQQQQPQMSTNQQLLEQHQRRAEQIAAAGWTPSMRGSSSAPPQQPMRNAGEWYRAITSQLRG